jgi:pyrimidine-specific ribonucleoside hydrolase
MKPKRALLLCVLGALCLFTSVAGAHDKISVLVDTDMALDDVRALAMLLNSDLVDIPLIVTSDGGASPEVGCRNVTLLLTYFDKKDVKVAQGKGLEKAAPPWRAWSEKISWPESFEVPPVSPSCPPAAATIVNTLNASGQPTLYLCLGPLTNLAEALALDPEIQGNISRLIYYGAPPDSAYPGWNTDRDDDAARTVFASDLNISSISLPEKQLVLFDQALYDALGAIDTPAAGLVTSIHRPAEIRKLLQEGHFHVWDEMAVIYLSRPSLFTFVPSPGHDQVMMLSDFKQDGVRHAYAKALARPADFHLTSRQAVVLKAFPTDPLLFRADVGPHVQEIIDTYGLEEWKACVLTNELHRHLGIYSLIGAKMGTRAREILEAPFDALQVVSHAGSTPPLSCMNDGLQVSTGASLGRGTIKIAQGEPKPEAVFIHGSEKVTLTIKKEILEKIKEDIQKALKIYGGMNSNYFSYIRQLSLDYWFNLDRNYIFEEVLTSGRRTRVTRGGQLPGKGQ